MFEWMTGLIQDAGYLGIALLMLAENVFPPIPSELIMPLAGFTAARGELNLVLVILMGTLGSLAGAIFWYLIGRWVGHARVRRFAERHGRWLTLSPSDVDAAQRWFDRHGTKAVLIGRLIPAIRSLISIPAGIAAMPFWRFLVATTIGTALWTTLLALAGYFLESQYERVEAYLDPASKVVIGLVIALYLFRVATHRRRHPG